MIVNTSSQTSQKLFIYCFNPSLQTSQKQLQQILMNSPTDRDADGRDSHKNVGENKIDYSLDHSLNSASQYKKVMKIQEGEMGDGKKVMMGNCLSLLKPETAYLMVVVLLFIVLQRLK